MAADLRVVALGWSQDHVERFFDGIEAGRQRLAELLHAIRTERLVCGHLAGELQGEDGGTRWCAGCEREAGIRAETEARVVEAAVRAAEILARQRQGAWRVADAIRALAPADYVAVRREDFEVIAEAAEELEARIRMERAGYESSRADEIRVALSRARKGE